MNQPTLFDTPTQVPFVRHSQTSIKAARKVSRSGNVERDRRLILQSLAKNGEQTDEQLFDNLCPPINANALRPRRLSLVEKGFVNATFGKYGKTQSGNNATLWHITQKGYEELVRLQNG